VSEISQQHLLKLPFSTETSFSANDENGRIEVSNVSAPSTEVASQREISAPSTKVDLPDSKISQCHLPQLSDNETSPRHLLKLTFKTVNSTRHQLKLLANTEFFAQVMNKTGNVRIT
jgi:hypothetical protein